MLSLSLRNRVGFAIFGFAIYFLWSTLAASSIALIFRLSIPSTKAFEDLAKNYSSNGVNSTTNTTDALIGDHVTVHGKVHEPYCSTTSKSDLMIAMFIPVIIGRILYPAFLLNIYESRKIEFVAVVSIIGIFFVGVSGNIPWIIVGSIINSISFGIGCTTILIACASHGGKPALSGFSGGLAFAMVLTTFSFEGMSSIMPLRVIVFLTLICVALIAVAYCKIFHEVDGETHHLTLPHGGAHGIVSKQPRNSLTNQQSHTTSLTTASAQLAHSSADNHPTKEQQPHHTFSTYHLQTADERAKLLSSDHNANQYNNANNYSQIDISGELTSLKKIKLLFPTVFPLLLLGTIQFTVDYLMVEITGLIYDEFISSFIRSIGILIAMSSVEIFSFNKNLWIPVLIEIVNGILYLLHVYKIIHLPGIGLIAVLLLIQGFTSGLVYVNSFNKLNETYDKRYLAFATSVVSNTCGFGAALGFVINLLIRRSICRLYV